MALGDVYMSDTDGFIGRLSESTNTDAYAGLLIDISQQKNLFTGDFAVLKDTLEGTVVALTSASDTLITGNDGVFKKLLNGIPYYHIQHFFKENSDNDKVLFISFADCSQNWDALINIQRASNGMIQQLGIFTEQSLFAEAADTSAEYEVQLVSEIETVMESMANDYHSPAIVILTANTAKVKTSTGTSNTVELAKIPTCKIGARYVSVLLGQDSAQGAVQAKLDSTTPVGLVGCALGKLATLGAQYNLGIASDLGNIEDYITDDIEFGFGDSTVKDGALAVSMAYNAVSNANLDTLEDKGYIFVQKRYGVTGVWFTNDTTCALEDSDYRRIALNRTINKTRRVVRAALLPFVNSPIAVDPTTGQLSTTQATSFYQAVRDALLGLVTDGVLVAVGTISVPTNQSVLQTDKIKLTYSAIPYASGHEFDVQEYLSTTNA